MTTLDYSTINLGLPAVPETTDPKLFQELVRVYNAIKILAQGVDVYTTDGTVTNSVAAIADQLEGLVDNSSKLSELRKQYYRYTVPKFTVKGAFACNGKTPQTSLPITVASGTASGGGVGTAAGGFPDAATRDQAVTAINANAAAIAEVQNILKQFGLAS